MIFELHPKGPCRRHSFPMLEYCNTGDAILYNTYTRVFCMHFSAIWRLYQTDQRLSLNQGLSESPWLNGPSFCHSCHQVQRHLAVSTGRLPESFRRPADSEVLLLRLILAESRIWLWHALVMIFNPLHASTRSVLPSTKENPPSTSYAR